MASSSTAIPDIHPARTGGAEQEPLLGRPGDAAQSDGKSIWYNLFIGTAPIAQIGIWVFALIVWISVLRQDVSLFSAHPLLNSAGILLLTQGALILQPTHTAAQKRQGTILHSLINGAGALLLVCGLIIIEINKIQTHHSHFGSSHAILGLITSILLILQALVGITQYYFPGLYGSVANAKKIYKYHRMAGYVILPLALATATVALHLYYNTLWSVLIADLLVLAGVLPRIKKQKLGF
ncbi:MAG: hypothetical protein M1816_000862 [Peltula sp. TS41687]|nr:MAG: hypothetical protein M1816_000862 [Peltula sp. TS41687]